LNRHKSPISLYLLCITLSISLTGCDFFSQIGQYFNKSDSPKESSQTAAVDKPAKGNNQKSLQRNELARLGSWSISVEEFDERLKALKQVVPDYDIEGLESKKAVLDELVRQQLLVHEAEKSGLANNKDIVMAVDEFRRTLIVREIAKNITEKIKVSDEEVQQFYEENKDVLVDPFQWHVREIKVETQLKANELLVQILDNGDFATIAKQHSLGSTAADGGDLGFIVDVPFVEMGNPLLPLQPGEVSSVFKGPGGYYIVKLEEKTGGGAIALEDIRGDIIQNRTLFKQQQAIVEYIQNLEQNSTVERNDSLLSP